MKTARKIVFPYFYLWNIDGKMFEMNCSDAKHTGIGKAGTMSKALIRGLPETRNLRAEISCPARPAHRSWTTTRAKPLAREECRALFRIKANLKDRDIEPN